MARVFVLFLLFASAFTFADSTKPIDFALIWTLSLDASGAITSLKPADERVPEIYRRLDAAVHSWHFTTGKVNGAPSPTETTLTLHLTLEPIAEGYRIRLRRAVTGPAYATRAPPTYPDGALMSHRGGAVLLSIHYDAAGNVIDAQPIEGGEPKAGSDIARAAVVAVKKWTLKPEMIAGHGLAGAATVPVCFSVPQKPINCHFTDPASKRVLEDDHGMLADSVVHIDTDIAGRML